MADYFENFAQHKKYKSDQNSALTKFFNDLVSVIQRSFHAWEPEMESCSSDRTKQPYLKINFKTQSSNEDFLNNVKAYLLEISESRLVCSTIEQAIKISTTEEKLKTFKRFSSLSYFDFVKKQKDTETKKETHMSTQNTKMSKRSVYNILRSSSLKSGKDYLSVVPSSDGEHMFVNAKTVEVRRKIESLLSSLGYELQPASKEKTQKSLRVLSGPPTDFKKKESQMPIENPKETPVKKENLEISSTFFEKFLDFVQNFTEEEKDKIREAVGAKTQKPEDTILLIDDKFVLISKTNPVVDSLKEGTFSSPDEILEAIQK